MRVIVAKNAGVCFGVKRALDLVQSESERGPLATLGPLIHNPQVVQELEEKGVRVIRSIEEAEGGAVVMPSHGVPREVRQAAEDAGLKVVDATCPFVASVHEKVRDLASRGYLIVVVGDEGHSEVKAIKSAAGEAALVVASAQEAAKLDWSGRKVGIVSQTTQVPERFGQVVGVIASSARELVAYNTICYATHGRQSAARDLAPKVEAMFVVGGRNSANTNRLAGICADAGVPTYHIETASEIQEDWVKGMHVVGLTAGASTPGWIIKQVKARLQRL